MSTKTYGLGCGCDDCVRSLVELVGTDARAATEAEIVAWLRATSNFYAASTYAHFYYAQAADAIERGGHRK